MRTLTIRYGTSRGRETYGYTTVTLSENGRRIASTCGGGYDMKGTVFGEWLAKSYPEKLAALKPEVTEQYGSTGYAQAPRSENLYGITWRPDGSASLDGACGFESMRRLAERIGLSISTIDAGRSRDVLLVTESA